MLPEILAMCLRQNVGDNGLMVRHCAFFRRHSESQDPSVLGGICVNIFRKSFYPALKGKAFLGILVAFLR